VVSPPPPAFRCDQLALMWSRAARRGGVTRANWFLAATLGAMFLCGATDLCSSLWPLENLSVSKLPCSRALHERDAATGEAALKNILLVGFLARAAGFPLRKLRCSHGASPVWLATRLWRLLGLACNQRPPPFTALALGVCSGPVGVQDAPAVPISRVDPGRLRGARRRRGSRSFGGLENLSRLLPWPLRLLVGCFEQLLMPSGEIAVHRCEPPQTLDPVGQCWLAAGSEFDERQLAYRLRSARPGFVGMIGLVCGTE